MRLVYGMEWADGYSDLKIEMEFVRAGGHISGKSGKRYGEGLFHHFRRAQMLLWPDDDHHRWSDLILGEYLKNRITIVQGPKDTGKTHVWSRIALTDYWCFPSETLWLVSSTDSRGLELRVWGDIKDLFNRARERYPALAGHVLESKKGIFTDDISEEDQARDIRKGMICIPCIGGNGEWVGIEKFCGIKQKRRRLLADELQFMKSPYLISLEHLDKGDFKMGGSGNPIGQRDPLDILAEPEAGWGSEVDSGKTDVWKNKFGGVTVQLDGRDTLNNDEPKNKFTYILNQSDIDRTTKRYGTDSSTYWNQIIGRRKSGLDAHRVLTREMCIRYEVFRNVVWEGEDRTSIFSMDAAFGGDRAVGGRIEFGKEVGGQNVILVHPPSIFPVKISKLETAEEQLASQSKKYTDLFGIPDRNVFFDAGMYATLATNMAKTVGVNVNAVNFQGKATTRPVSNDEFVFDEISGGKRLKRCDEAYSKFVTELWWSVRLVAESHQLAGLPEEVAEEFAMREWYKVNGDRFELETKEETKARMGCSPDLADWLAIAVEGARRLGFIIERIRTEETEKEEDDWLERELEKHKRSFAASELKAL